MIHNHNVPVLEDTPVISRILTWSCPMGIRNRRVQLYIHSSTIQGIVLLTADLTRVTLSTCLPSQVQLEKARLFLSSLKSAESKLVTLVNKSSQLPPKNGTAQDPSSQTEDSSQGNGHVAGSLASGDGQIEAEVASVTTISQGLSISVGVDDSTVSCNDLQLWCSKLLKQVEK